MTITEREAERRTSPRKEKIGRRRDQGNENAPLSFLDLIFSREVEIEDSVIRCWYSVKGSGRSVTRSGGDRKGMLHFGGRDVKCMNRKKT